MAEANDPGRKPAVSRLRELARRKAVVGFAGAVAAGLLAAAASQRSTTSFIADARTLNHAYVRAAEESIHRKLGFDARVSELRLERLGRSTTLRARIRIADGGIVDLQVNHAGQGAERTGLLLGWNIRVQMDSVAGQVLRQAEARQTPPPPKQHSTWPKHFIVETIRVPFSIGRGQLVIHDAVLTAQVANATLQGRVDLSAQTINVSGTYLPTSNLTLATMPTLLTGPLGDGIFGVRLAIQGALAKPDIIVNPMWLIPPGFFRKIFEFQPREETNK